MAGSERNPTAAQLEAIRVAALRFAKSMRDLYWIEGLKSPAGLTARDSIFLEGMPALLEFEKTLNPSRLAFDAPSRTSFTSVGWPDAGRLLRLIQWLRGICDIVIREWQFEDICISTGGWYYETTDSRGLKKLDGDVVAAMETAGQQLGEYLAEFGHLPPSPVKTVEVGAEPLPQKKTGRPSKSLPRATVNARMIDEMNRTPASKDWTAQQWLKRLSCSKSAILKTAAWKMIVQNRAALRKNRKSRTPKRYET